MNERSIVKTLKIGVVAWNPVLSVGWSQAHMLATVTGEYTIRETGCGEPNKITLVYSHPPAPVLSQYHNDYSELHGSNLIWITVL